jgi:hypothetical protein
MYWQKSTVLSPIGESPEGVLVKAQWTFANWRNSRGHVGESHIGENLIGEIPKSRFAVSAS